MARYTDPNALLRKQKGLMADVVAQAEKMHREAVRGIAVEVARELLSGTTSQAQLDRMGNPFARRRLRGRFKRSAMKGGQRLSEVVSGRHAGAGVGVPKLPINRQTGELKRSMRIRGAASHTGQQTLVIGFGASHAKYVLGKRGTRLMVARGFQAAKGRIDKARNKRLQYDLKRMVLASAVRGRV